MCIKHISTIGLLLLGLSSAPLLFANDDPAYLDTLNEDNAHNGKPFDIKELEKFPPYTIARDIVKNVDENVYPVPQSAIPSVEYSEKSCVALDDEIVALTPLTYRTVPDFYDDPKNAAAIWLTTTGVVLFDIFPETFPQTEVPFGYAYLAYPGYKKYKEKERIRRASLHIESLRRAKARKRCFEAF